VVTVHRRVLSPSVAIPPRYHRHSLLLGSGGIIHLPFTLRFPWLIVASHLVAPPQPLPLVFTKRCLSSCSATSASRRLEAPPAFETPLLLVCWRPPSRLPLVSRLVVATPLVVPPPLVLSTHRRAAASYLLTPPLLFASRAPAGCQVDATTSRPLDAPSPSLDAKPLPHDGPSPLVHWCLSFLLLLVSRLVVASPLAAPPLLRITFPRAAASRVILYPPPLFARAGWLLCRILTTRRLRLPAAASRWPPAHVTPATRPPVHLSFAPAG
jgi:hypothetical protein